MINNIRDEQPNSQNNNQNIIDESENANNNQSADEEEIAPVVEVPGATKDTPPSTDLPPIGDFALIFAIMGIIAVVVSLISIISMWKIFTKAGEKGWKSLVPIYNIIVLVKIVELPTIFVILSFIPIVQIYAIIKIFIELAHKFGKDTMFGILTAFFPIVCLPIIALGNATYNNSDQEAQVDTNTAYSYSMQSDFPNAQYQANEYENNQAQTNNYTQVPNQAQVNLDQYSNQINQNIQNNQVNQTPNELNGGYQEPSITNNTKVCPNCGSIVMLYQDTCPNCGNQFNF